MGGEVDLLFHEPCQKQFLKADLASFGLWCLIQIKISSVVLVTILVNNNKTILLSHKNFQFN